MLSRAHVSQGVGVSNVLLPTEFKTYELPRCMTEIDWHIFQTIQSTIRIAFFACIIYAVMEKLLSPFRESPSMR